LNPHLANQRSPLELSSKGPASALPTHQHHICALNHFVIRPLGSNGRRMNSPCAELKLYMAAPLGFG
jgi:hypothetical protein